MRCHCIIRLKLLLLFYAAFSIHTSAQESKDHIQSLESLYTDWIENNPQSDIEALFQELAELMEQPVNINNAEREQLEALPFLSPEQKDHLAYFLYRNKPLSNLSQLLLCEGMDELSFKRISPFLYVGKAMPEPMTEDWKSWLNRGKHDFSMYAASSIQQKKGLINATDSALRATGKAYLGLPFSGIGKYQYSYGRKLQYGLVLEHDLGEKPADFLSFHIVIHEVRNINTFILGDYRLNLGQGLIVSSGFGAGKITSIAAFSGAPTLLRRHFSTSESAYFRGAAIDFSIWEYLQVLGFVSFRKVDSAVSDGTFSTIRTDGLHRTANELQSKKSLLQSSGGMRIGFNRPFFQCAFNALYYRFNAFCAPEIKPYSLHYFRGRDNLNLSLDYRFRLHGSLFSGESAFDKNGHTAHLHKVQYQPHSLVSVVHSFRYYSPAYNAFFASAFSENTQIRNEAGLFTTMEYRLFEHIKLNAYVDYFVFPWLKYGVNSPTAGHDLGLELSSYSNKVVEWSLRYREKTKTDNHIVEGRKGIYSCAANTKRQLRVQLLAQLGGLRLKTTADINQFKPAGASCSHGSLFAQEWRFTTPDAALSFSLQYAMFDTQTYENRVYFYEQDLPNVFSIPAYSGTGSSYVLCCRWKPAHNIKCWLRLKHRAYSDRSEVGSLLDVVQGNMLTEFRLGFQYILSAKSVSFRQNQHE